MNIEWMSENQSSQNMKNDNERNLFIQLYFYLFNN